MGRRIVQNETADYISRYLGRKGFGAARFYPRLAEVTLYLLQGEMLPHELSLSSISSTLALLCCPFESCCSLRIHAVKQGGRVDSPMNQSDVSASAETGGCFTASVTAGKVTTNLPNGDGDYIGGAEQAKTRSQQQITTTDSRSMCVCYLCFAVGVSCFISLFVFVLCVSADFVRILALYRFHHQNNNKQHEHNSNGAHQHTHRTRSTHRRYSMPCLDPADWKVCCVIG
jgi:hypothetical protein